MTRAWRLVLPAVLGGLLAGVWIGARCERAAARRMRREGPRPERMIKMLRRQMNLRNDQVEAVRKILESKRPEFQAIRRDSEARMTALRVEIDEAISPLLDEAQKKRKYVLRERWNKRMKESRPR
ncbi:MAG: hypothetical protein COV48_09720 [Elusimicrobia bacterium CG11_big_fil_rev_8_21_14_0_20_64_6]|nr:MAG: hypothetical protein COV48_09720 [Elusimicrobia bacterium CG11_big_fil_rev_8_21_14_0_20_64_6]